MLNQDQLREVMGTTAYDSDGDKIGKVGQVYLDDNTGEPEWITVNTGFFGTSESFVPVRDVEFAGDRVVVNHDKDRVKDAPRVSDDGHLDPEEERRLYDHYGVDWGTSDTTYSDTTYSDTTDTGYAAAGTTTDGGRTDTVGHDTSGPTTDDAMTRSEEQLHVGTTRREAGQARLRKYVVTEQETVNVPVRKERAVLETEPITDANVGTAESGPAISEEEHEVTLHEEQVEVGKTAKPVERVRLGTTTEVEEETVTEDVRKERIEAEGDVSGGTNRI